jgi:phosphatidylserine synthase
VDQTIAVMAPALILAGWGFIRRAWLTRAILPTSIPTTDRFVTALVLVAATIIVLAGVSRLARLNRV